MGVNNESYKVLDYKEIKTQYGAKYGKGSVFIDFYVCAISPICTKIALALHLIPNTVTICMIISGLIGAGLFWYPNLGVKIVGVFFIHLWFVLDCSDGEVARITKRFSNYGEELDFMAHSINHPIFILSFLVAILSDMGFDLTVIICTVFIISADNVLRMVYMMHHIDAVKNSVNNRNRQDGSPFSIKEIIIFIVNIFAQFPNFALIFPVVYLINRQAGIYYLMIDMAVAVLYSIYCVVRWIKKIHMV